jgi:eukaryotic-like serine/threonine-protein kinase
MTEPETNEARATTRSDQLTGGTPFVSEQSIGPGTKIDGTYLIERQIGQGGMGTVYLGRHIGLQSDYAIKILDCLQTDTTLWQRFKNEARAIAKLNHPNIVKIHNMGVHEQALPYYAMDFITGETLAQKLKKQGKLTVEESLLVFIQVCNCLDFAHNHEIIHRDIKPANIMITEAQQVKLLDFGLAKFTGSLASQTLTATGEVFGSPSYMSPEQALGKKVDERSDIYSTAVALFETLTGVLPFSSKNYVQTMLKVQNENPPSLCTASGGVIFPSDLEAVINQALRKNPAQRYQHIDQMGEDLRLLLKGRPPKHLHQAEAMPPQEPDNKASPPGVRDKPGDSTVAQDNDRTIAILAGLALLITLAALLASIGSL